MRAGEPVFTNWSQGNAAVFVAVAENDPEIRAAILSDDQFRETLALLSSNGDDRNQPIADTEPMVEITREELNSTLSAIEERMDSRVERMERDADRRAQEYRHELALRDEQIRRELDLRQQSFRTEQAARDAALAEKFSGFLAAQAERDMALEKISEARFERIEKDITSIKGDVKTITADVQGIKVTMAKYLGAAVVIGAIASATLGAALKHFFQ